MLSNTSDAYGLISILLHWLMAVFVFGLFGLGLYMVGLSYYDPWYKDALDLHKSTGICLFFILLTRLIWRCSQITPDSCDTDSPQWQIKLAHLVHILLYIVMAVLMISGYFISTADDRSISVFGMVDIPALGFSIENQEDVAGDLHASLAWSLVTFSGIHALAAFKHHFINKNNTLKRIIGIR